MLFANATTKRGAAAFTLLAALTIAAVPATAATCSDASLHGTYGYMHGIVATDVKVVGQLKANGKGELGLRPYKDVSLQSLL